MGLVSGGESVDKEKSREGFSCTATGMMLWEPQKEKLRKRLKPRNTSISIFWRLKDSWTLS